MAETSVVKHSKFLIAYKRLRRVWFAIVLASTNSAFACRARTKIFILLGILGFLTLALFLSALYTVYIPPETMQTVLISLSLAGLLTLLALLYYFQRDFLVPLMHLRHWVHLIRGGNLQAQLPVVEDAEFADLAEDLNMVGMMLLRLSEDAENQLQEHTRHITAKTRSLQILYNLAASLNYSSDLDELLGTFLEIICAIAHAEAATVRLVDDNSFRLAKARRLEKFSTLDSDNVSIEDYPSGQEIMDGKVVWDENTRWENHREAGENDLLNVGIVSVPLTYRDRTLGVFNLLVDPRTLDRRDEMNSLFLSIGQHCGMAIEKTRLDAEAHRLNIMEEREHISAELHDSLAQTLVSLRFQVRVLDETLESDDKDTIWQQLERIENTVDEANTELRELITHFRAPVDKRGVLIAVKQFARRFQEETGISTFLQQEWPAIELPGHIEIQVLRIIQETLANIRKHSKANTVRILLRGNPNGEFHILVEDDGDGFEKPPVSTHPGQHIGLGIMRERAQKIGGKIIVDSEPGEGTRIILKFNYPLKKSAALQRESLAANNQDPKA